MSTKRAHNAIAAGTCLTFGLATAVAVGAVPQAGSATPGPTVNAVAPRPDLAQLLLDPDLVLPREPATPLRRVMFASHPHIAATSTAPSRHARHSRHLRVPHHASAQSSSLIASVTVAPAVATADGPSAESANFKQAPAKKHHHKKHHHKKRHHHKRTHATKPALAARTTPTASAVSKAIAGLRNYVHTPLTPTAAQVAEFGDAVCTAFDQGETFSNVKAQILAQVKKLPFTTVAAGAADYVVKTAVSLYCPGYQSKVS